MARVSQTVLALLWAVCAAGAVPAEGLADARSFPCGCPLDRDQRLPVVSAKPRPARKQGAVHVLVDLEWRELTVYVDYVPVRKYPVAIGKVTTPSPVGDWRIVEKAKWGEGFGSRWMQISVPWGTYGIHGTNKPWTIGDAVSGGCIRMFNADADEVYTFVQVGTPVKFIGHPLGPLDERETLEPGYMSSRVMLVQRALKKAGYYAGPLDGAWGMSSVEAAKVFQRAKGLPATGSFDPLSYDALGLIKFE